MVKTSDFESENSGSSPGEAANLRAALSKCLSEIHNYFGMTDPEMVAALDDAAKNPDWSPYDSEKWRSVAIPTA